MKFFGKKLLFLPKSDYEQSTEPDTHSIQHQKPQDDYREDVYRFIWHLCKEMNCYLVRINGIPNHIHILVNINPSISLSEFVRIIKQQSSNWMKACGKFPDFEGWGKEYGAFSVSESAKFVVIEYIKGQQEHHRRCTFENEYKELCSKNGLGFTNFDLT